jgi:hypothetical protein
MMTRPRGSFGDIARALRTAAEQGPGTVRELAARAQVGQRCAWYTANRLIGAGELAIVREQRPMVLMLGDGKAAAPAAHNQANVSAQHQALDELHRLWWA